LTDLSPLPIFRQVSNHANDIALVIYTIAVVVWGSVFALVFHKKWRTWRNWHRGLPFTSDEWILIGFMLVGLLLGIVYMLTFLHGKPPGIPLVTGER
jgi:hypothetical protein